MCAQSAAERARGTITGGATGSARTFCSRKREKGARSFCSQLIHIAYKKNDRLAVSNHRGASVLKRLKRLSSTMYIVIYLSIVREAP
jgi:hypothetical protein